LAKRITEQYQLSLTSHQKVLSDLLSMQIIDQKPDEALVERIASETTGNPAGFVIGILEAMGLYYSFDAEVGMIPVTYDTLLSDFIAKSKGILNSIIFWVDTKEKGSSGNIEYTITVVSNNKVFIAKPIDYGDWYDIMLINALLEKILSDMGSDQRFISVEIQDQTVQYLFGQPARINTLIKKFNLN